MKAKSRILCIFLAFVLISVMAGCKSTSSSSLGNQSTTKSYTIGFAMCTGGEPYWDADILGAQNEAKALGVKLIVQSAQNNVTTQAQQIQNFIAQKVDAIICSPVDNKAIQQSIAKCTAAKIPFICNSRVTESTADAKVAYSIAYDDVDLGGKGAQWFVDYAKKNNTKIKVLEVMGAMTDSNAISLKEGFNKVVAANPDYIQSVQQVPTDWDAQKALTGTLAALQAHPEINAIFYHSDFFQPTMVSALQQMNRYIKAGTAGHVLLMPNGGTKDTLDAMKDGYVDCCQVDPILEVGSGSVQAAVDILNGKTLDGTYKMMPGYLLDSSNYAEKSATVWGYLTAAK
jgi:ABC-type sugar transport system substrate-binding protein